MRSLSTYFLPRPSTYYEQTQRNRMLYVMLMAVFAGAAFTGLENLLEGWHREAAVLFALAVACLLGFHLAQVGFSRLAALVLCIVLGGAIDTALYYGTSLYDAGIVAFPIFMIIATFLFGRNGLVWSTLAAVGSVAGLFLLERGGVIRPALFPVTLHRMHVVMFLLIVGAAVLWAVRGTWDANVRHMQESYDLTLAGWARALEYRDMGTAGHTRRVAELTVALARRLKCSEREIGAMRRGAFLHDIGKMAVPDRILLKPGPLTANERAIMEQHTTLGRDFVSGIPVLHPATDIPYSHHERWDGTGYPSGLRGDAIPLAARIFAVVDVWDALNSDRPYRKAWPRQAVIDYIQAGSGTIFDPRITAAFLDLIREGTTDRVTRVAGAEPMESPARM